MQDWLTAVHEYLTSAGQKKVSFKSTGDAVLPESEPKAAPRTGIVSAVVERLRRLSSWGIAQRSNDAESSPNPDSDLPEPEAEKADLRSEPKQAGQGPRKRQRAAEVPVQYGVSSHASQVPNLLKGWLPFNMLRLWDIDLLSVLYRHLDLRAGRQSSSQSSN